MINQQLIDYIQQQRASNVPDADIKKSLTDIGWETADIEAGFGSLVENDVVITELKEEPKKEKKPKTRVILIGVAVIAGLIGLGIWTRFPKSNVEETDVINPSAENTPIVTPKPEKVTQNNNQYVNQNYHFKINYPKEWKSEENGSAGVIVNMINPSVDTDKGNRFATNINVVSESTGNLTLTDYVAMSKKVLNESFTNYTNVSEEPVDIKGKPGVLIEATYEMGVYKLHNIQLFVVNDGRSYVITATALNSVWSTYKAYLNQNVLSFELI
jgi:hypothetical protein